MIGWTGGNAVGPLFFQAKWAPRYINTLYIHIAFYGLYMINAFAIRWLLKKRNEDRDKALEVEGRTNAHEHAFDDLTDRQNDEFRYSY